MRECVLPVNGRRKLSHLALFRKHREQMFAIRSSGSIFNRRVGQFYSGGNNGTYGSPRVHMELLSLGLKTSRKRVARIMKIAGLIATIRRQHRSTTLNYRSRCDVPEANVTKASRRSRLLP